MRRAARLVLHLLKGGQHGLAVSRYGCVELRFGQTDFGVPFSAFKNRLGQAGSKRPEAAGQRKPLGDVRRLEATLGRKSQRGIKGRDRDSDLLLSGGQVRSAAAMSGRPPAERMAARPG